MHKNITFVINSSNPTPLYDFSVLAQSFERADYNVTILFVGTNNSSTPLPLHKSTTISISIPYEKTIARTLGASATLILSVLYCKFVLFFTLFHLRPSLIFLYNDRSLHSSPGISLYKTFFSPLVIELEVSISSLAFVL